MKVRPFQRTTEASFPENESLPKKGEDEKKFDKRFSDWWDDVKENLARLNDQMETYIRTDLNESIQVNKKDVETKLVVASRDLDTQITTQATESASLDQRVGVLETALNNHVSASNNPHTVTAAQLGLHALATSGDWSDIANKPATFPPTAHTHAISEVSTLQSVLNNKADVSALFSGDYDDLTNKPTLFSGDYDDLTNKPTIPTVPGNATTSADGLMSSGDKTKLDTFDIDSTSDAVGIGIDHEDAYALKTSKLKIEGTATQMHIKDSDETGTPTEIAISLNEKALRFGFQDSPTTQAFAIFGRSIKIAGGTVAELNALTAEDGALLHQIAVCSNGNAGQPCLAMYTGVHGSGGSWKVLATVGSTISP